MHIPHDISLTAYINSLYEAHKIYKFYKTREWLELRQEVMADNNNECMMCKQHGRYSHADTVHHINEVRHRPDLALSRYYVDIDGIKQTNLVPLCKHCHNLVHDRVVKPKTRRPLLNEERW